MSAPELSSRLKYAFNINLHHFEHGKGDTSTWHKILMVHLLTKATGNGQYDRLKAITGENAPPIQPHPDETDESAQYAAKCVYVGFMVPTIETDVLDVLVNDEGKSVTGAMAKGERKKEHTGACVNNMKRMNPHSERWPFFRVVTPCDNAKAEYYALYEKEANSGRCNGIRISMADVFFFSEFRDDSCVSTRDRKSACSRLVNEMREKHDPNRESKASKQDRFNAMTAFQLPGIPDRPRDLVVELAELLTEYELNNTSDGTELEHSLRIIGELEPAFTLEKPVKNTQLSKLLDGVEPTSALCDAAYEELKDMWPDIADILGNQQKLQKIFVCINAAKITVPYDGICDYLVVGANQVDLHGDSKSNREIGEGCKMRVKALRRTGTARAHTVSNSSIENLCKTITNKLRNQEETWDFIVHHMRDSFKAPKGKPLTITQLYEQYGAAPDKDSAIYVLRQVWRMATRETTGMFDSSRTELHDTIKWLDSLSGKLVEETE